MGNMSSSLPASNSLPATELAGEVTHSPSLPSSTEHPHHAMKFDTLASTKLGTQEHLREILDGRERQRKGIGGPDRPLQLLDLSVDVLRGIINEITHTNDLASLALTCSALHGLAIPSIYSRFDIVWPDAHSNSDARQGVDALTYGLATLVMGDEPCNVTQTAEYTFGYWCAYCGIRNTIRTSPQLPALIHRRRKGGNYYPHYTTKFSLGNGPQEWVKEYLINRESGKMLGTLVALALERMPVLQDFTWDMPTGILRDCWLALSQASTNGRERDLHLNRVWVRFHDNREIMDAPQVLPTASQGTHYSPGNPPGPSQTQSSNYFFNGTQSPSPLIWSYRHIEWPSFSVLPALRSLNVLNIDEIAYLEEMSVLIERSMAKMRELRIGLAHKVPEDGFASTRDLAFPTVDEEPTEYEHALRRLMSKLLKVEEHDCPKSSDSKFLPSPGARTHVEPHSSLGSKDLTTNPCPTASPGHIVSNQTSDDRTNLPGDVLQVVSRSDPAGVLASLVIKDQVNTLANKSIPSGIDASAASSSSAAPDGDISHGVSAIALDPLTEISSLSSDHAAKQNRGDEGDRNDAKMPTSAGEEGLDRTHQKKRLRLEILELESFHVLFDVLLDTINWSTLTTLTLLHCDSSEGLWRALRRAFTPRPIPSQPVLRRKSKMHLGELSSKDLLGVPPSEYQLSLRRIHTNTVSPALIAFLRETLAPDSLEWLFLQDAGMVSNSTGGRGSYDSNVSVEAIFHGPLRRHRHSLKKLMIDSDDRPVNSRRKTAKWHKWKVDRNLLAFVTSGKMSALREMAISIDYKDWHFFLQRLPQVPHIRSLYLRHGADHPHEQHFNPKELALQVMDIVSIRPEMELCYLGIASKCFEILEGDDEALAIHQSPATAANTGPNDASTDEDSDDGEHGDTAEGDHEGQTAHAPEDSDADSQPESVEFSDDEATELDGRAKIPRLELREILFYDDKISIFKARHAKL